MFFGDGAGNRQTEAATGCTRLRAAKKAVEHALTIRRRYARSGVLDGQAGAFVPALDGHIYLALGRCVFDRVFQQVAQQDQQRVRIALHPGRIRRYDAQVDGALLRLRQYVGHGLLHQVLQVQALHGQRGRAIGFVPRQSQQLVHEPDRAFYALVEPCRRQCARAVVAGARQRLRLQLEGSQRRAQFVRGIGHKRLLRVERAVQARKQQVDFLHQRTHFVRQLVLMQGREIVRGPSRYLLARALDRVQRTAYHPPQDQHQQRRDHGHRQYGARRQCSRTRLAAIHVLRDLYGLKRGLNRIHAVTRAVLHYVGEAEHRARGQCQPPGLEQLRPVRPPDLDHVVHAVVVHAFEQWHRQRRPAAQGIGHLLQVVVEHGVGLRQCTPVGGPGLEQGRQHNRRHDRGQQAPAQGMGRRGLHDPVQLRGMT